MQISTYLTFKGNCNEAIEFYKKELGATVTELHFMGGSPMDTPETKLTEAQKKMVMHATLKIGNSQLMVSDTTEPNHIVEGSNMTLTIGACKDLTEAKATFAKLAAGGIVMMPFEKTFFAEGFGLCKDRFGIQWMVYHGM